MTSSEEARRLDIRLGYNISKLGALDENDEHDEHAPRRLSGVGVTSWGIYDLIQAMQTPAVILCPSINAAVALSLVFMTFVIATRAVWEAELLCLILPCPPIIHIHDSLYFFAGNFACPIFSPLNTTLSTLSIALSTF